MLFYAVGPALEATPFRLVLTYYTQIQIKLDFKQSEDLHGDDNGLDTGNDGDFGSALSTSWLPFMLL